MTTNDKEQPRQAITWTAGRDNGQKREAALSHQMEKIKRPAGRRSCWGCCAYVDGFMDAALSHQYY